MIDKLEVRVPASARFTPEFESLRREWDEEFKRSRHYLAIADLRPFGFSSILHMRSRQSRDHKLELIDTGVMSYTDMQREIERVFEVDARTTEVMRLDLAADMQGTPVQAFVGNVRAKFKRSATDLGRYSRTGKVGVETVYLGKRPNVFRIYNKIAECHSQYARLKRRARGKPIASFEKLFGYPAAGLVLTRVERQIAGGRVPTEISTFGKLVILPEFDPFESLEITIGSAAPPNPEDYPWATYLKGRGLRQVVLDHGYQNARRLANKFSPGNANRLFKMLDPFLPASDCGLTKQQILEVYRKSVSKQLAA
jgi:hypothetical protein